jgi:phenylalanine-4-hydroxylase
MLHLDSVKKNRPGVAHLIDGGLELIFEKEKAV